MERMMPITAREYGRGGALSPGVRHGQFVNRCGEHYREVQRPTIRTQKQI